MSVKAIALETSGRTGSVAIVEDGRVLATDSFQYGLQNAAMILPMIDKLVRAHHWQPSQIQQVYVSQGPGSFTGLRIGITLAKTLAFSIGAKIVPVSSARVLLYDLPIEIKEVIIVLDAKRGQIFTARYIRPQGATHIREWFESELEHLDTLTNMLNRAGRPVHLIGEGIPYHRDVIPSIDSVKMIDESLWRARVEGVVEIAWDYAQAGAFADPYKLTPTYIRLPEAEEKRLAMLNPNP